MVRMSVFGAERTKRRTPSFASDNGIYRNQLSKDDYRNDPPMTLGNMRANGVQTLAVYCSGRGCNHEAVLDVSCYPDFFAVPLFGPRMVCSVCGAIGADARPNWNERARTIRRSASAALFERCSWMKPCEMLKATMTAITMATR